MAKPNIPTATTQEIDATRVNFKEVLAGLDGTFAANNAQITQASLLAQQATQALGLLENSTLFKAGEKWSSVYPKPFEAVYQQVASYSQIIADMEKLIAPATEHGAALGGNANLPMQRSSSKMER